MFQLFLSLFVSVLSRSVIGFKYYPTSPINQRLSEKPVYVFPRLLPAANVSSEFLLVLWLVFLLSLARVIFFFIFAYPTNPTRVLLITTSDI